MAVKSMEEDMFCDFGRTAPLVSDSLRPEGKAASSYNDFALPAKNRPS